MLTIRQVLAGTTGLILVAAMASTVSAEGKRNRGNGGSQGDDDARAFSGPVCEVASDGHLQFVNGRSPFRGSSHGAYGGIFFAGGGTTLPTGSSARSNSGAGSS